MSNPKSNPAAKNVVADVAGPTISGIHDFAAALARMYAARRRPARKGDLHRV